MKRRIVLVTTIPPDTGGGVTNLRSLLPFLEEIELRWLYLGPRDLALTNAVWIGNPIQQFSYWKDLANASRLWVLRIHRPLQELIHRVCAEPGEMFWIVGHNEGLLIAREVAQRSGRPVHLTIHDDIPRGVFGRSRRYRWLQGFAERALREAFVTAKSVDVTSDGMRQYYLQRYGVESRVIHPYVPISAMADPAPFSNRHEAGNLLCGHIGSVYNVDELLAFCSAFCNVAETRARRPKILLIGCDQKILHRLKEYEAWIEHHPALSESEAVRRLSVCDLVYAMYPFQKNASVFRRTSLPTKLSTYVQAARPIFAHTPQDSSMAEAVTRFKVGKICVAPAGESLQTVLDEILQTSWPRCAFEQMRESYYGYHNVERMESYLHTENPIVSYNPIV